MSRYRLWWLLVAITTIGVVGVRSASVRAAGADISLTTSPVVLNLAIPAGGSDVRNLQLMNNGSAPLKIHMHLNVFSANGDNGDATITEPLPNDPSAGWVTFSPSSFTAMPGVWSQVKMTINLPKTATLGYYYAVLFEPEVSDQPSANRTVIHGSNAVLVLLDTHSGNENRTLSIADFKSSQGVYEYLPTTFTVAVRNDGNIYAAPTGTIYISTKSDATDALAALDVNPGEGNVLPHTTRTFSVDWSDGFPIFEDKKVGGQIVTDDHGKPIKQLSWSFAKLSKVRFGQYYAKLTLVYNDGKRVIPISRIISFWVIPWKLILMTVAIIIVLIVGLLTIGRYFLRAISRKKVYRM